jgi:membrane associated rhomboid family serine protease
MDDIVATPVSAAVCGFCVALWFYLWNKRVDYETIGFSYKKVVIDGERWRLVTSTFSHLEVFHVLFNVYSLWSCRVMELQFGAYYYVQTTCVLIVCAVWGLCRVHGMHMTRPHWLGGVVQLLQAVSCILLVSTYHLMIYYLGMTQYVRFSSVWLGGFAVWTVLFFF